jgi:hypothetical protein
MEDDEVDMLDLAFEVTDTSRLGCQIKVRKDMAGMKVRGECGGRASTPSPLSTCSHTQTPSVNP